jgi:asparagine synthase (glutamine-hydrolysing)
MCGISAIMGPGWNRFQLETMTQVQSHRGPDAAKLYYDAENRVGLGHNRLSIIDLSPNGAQPMSNSHTDRWIAFNGEVYNYRELRAELSEYPFRTQSDTEVILAAYERWGENCLDHLIGMFAFVLWDRREQKLLAVRDRFGVKPLFYHRMDDGTLYIASEIHALLTAGIDSSPAPETWASYLAHGLHDHQPATFWTDIVSLPPGHKLICRRGRINVSCWYDLAEKTGQEFDSRTEEEVADQYLNLLRESMRLRFRSDVPVGVALSGGLDSSILLSLVDSLGGKENTSVFTYTTGDPNYDELPWVKQMLAASDHPLIVTQLRPEQVPDLAASVQRHESEPFGGLPTLAYALLFEEARRQGIIVLCDGQGLDEQWAGYDYYRNPEQPGFQGPVQASKNRAFRPECLVPEFRAMAEPFIPALPFGDGLRNRQYFDALYAKIPRALRFNDRVSARSSTELREPFMDHRLFEIAFRQPAERKIRGGVHKWLLRQIARKLMPSAVAEAPKRPVQTPQREWLRGPLQKWALDCIEAALSHYEGVWLAGDRVRSAYRDYFAGGDDNSFYLWQWISLGLMVEGRFDLSSPSPNTPDPVVVAAASEHPELMSTGELQ